MKVKQDVLIMRIISMSRLNVPGRDALGFLSESSILPRRANDIAGVQDGSLLSLHAVIQSHTTNRTHDRAGLKRTRVGNALGPSNRGVASRQAADTLAGQARAPLALAVRPAASVRHGSEGGRVVGEWAEDGLGHGDREFDEVERQGGEPPSAVHTLLAAALKGQKEKAPTEASCSPLESLVPPPPRSSAPQHASRGMDGLLEPITRCVGTGALQAGLSLSRARVHHQGRAQEYRGRKGGSALVQGHM